MQTLFLNKDEDRRIRAGHLWVFSNEVNVQRSPLTGFAPGELARLVSEQGRPLGLVTVNPKALICGRLLSRDAADKPDAEFFKGRIARALELRQRFHDKPYYRLVFSEGDHLPGLIIDRYGAGLTLQVLTAGMEGLIEPILAALHEVLAPEWIMLKNDSPSRELEGLETYVKNAHGQPPAFGEVHEGACRFEFDLAGGQKTGWFYDQRENRLRLLELCRGARVLDAFSYVGALGVAAVKAGASEAILLDASAPALELAERNAEINGVADERLALMQGDCLESLEDLRQNKERFDVICLDPPAFIKRRKDQAKGLAAYRKVNRLAAGLLNPGGFLLTCSCSRHLSSDELDLAALKAFNAADRRSQLVWRGRQAADHPAHPAMAETEYLKAALFRAW